MTLVVDMVTHAVIGLAILNIISAFVWTVVRAYKGESLVAAVGNLEETVIRVFIPLRKNGDLPESLVFSMLAFLWVVSLHAAFSETANAAALGIPVFILINGLLIFVGTILGAKRLGEKKRAKLKERDLFKNALKNGYDPTNLDSLYNNYTSCRDETTEAEKEFVTMLGKMYNFDPGHNGFGITHMWVHRHSTCRSSPMGIKNCITVRCDDRKRKGTHEECVFCNEKP